MQIVQIGLHIRSKRKVHSVNIVRGVDTQDSVVNVSAHIAVNQVKICERSIVGGLQILSGKVNLGAVVHDEEQRFGICLQLPVNVLFFKGALHRQIHLLQIRL